MTEVFDHMPPEVVQDLDVLPLLEDVDEEIKINVSGLLIIFLIDSL